MWGILEQHKELVIKMINDGNSLYSIAKQMKCSNGCVQKFAKKHNLQSKHKFIVNSNGPIQDKENEIRKLVEEGNSIGQICKVIGYGRSCVSIFLKSKGLHTKDKTYFIDETYFKKIDNHEKAYYLGLLYADGCITNKNTIRISLQEGDRLVLDRFKMALKYEGPLYYVGPQLLKNKYITKPTIILSIGRISLYEDLIKLGVVPRKSLILKFPTEDQVPSEFINSFILGYMDGDGCIYQDSRHKNNFNISFLSNIDFIIGLKNVILNKFGVENKIIRHSKQSNVNTVKITFGKQQVVYNILTWLYKDSPVHMERKYNKYQEFLKIYHTENGV